MRKFLIILALSIINFYCFGSFDAKVEKMIIKEFEKKYKNDTFFCVQSPYYVEDENRNIKVVAAVYSENLNENRDIPIVLEINYRKKSDIKENLKKNYIETEKYTKNLKFIENRNKIENTIENITRNFAAAIIIYPENTYLEIESIIKNKTDYIKTVNMNIIILVKDIDTLDIEKYIENTKLISLFLLKEMRTVGEIKFNIIDDSYFTETTAKNNILHRIQRSLFYASLNAEPTIKILEKISSNKKISKEDREYLLKRFRELEKDTDQIEITINNENYLKYSSEGENIIKITKSETDKTGYITKTKIYKNGAWLEVEK